MPSEKLASAENLLKGNLASAWNILEGSSGDYTDLGIARRFGGSAAAYSLRDIGAMNGRVVEVRRSNDNATEDFSAAQVASGAVEAFVGGSNSGYVSKWYDQSGNGLDMAQSALADQPRIVNSGTLETIGGKPTVRFLNVGTNLGSTFLTATPISGGQNAFTHLIVASSENTGAVGQTFIGCTDGVDLRLSTLAMRIRSGNTNRTATANTLTSEANSLLTYLRTSDRVPKMALNNNSLEARSATPDAGADNLNQIMGENSTGASVDSFGLVGTISEAILYSGDKDAASELSELKTDINNYYSIF